MTATFQKLFHLLPGERGKVLHFALFAAMLQAGVAIGLTAADSLFLSHLGAERLPIVYLCMPVVMAVYAPVYSFLLARFGIDRLVQLTLGALALGGIAFGTAAGLLGEPPAWLLFAGKFYAGMWFIALYTLFWNFTDAYFSIRDGKRLYGIVAAGASLGGLVGAGLVTGLSRVLAPTQLYFAWSICAVLTFPLFVQLRRRHQPIESEDHEESADATPGQVLRVVFKTFGESRFALGVTALCFCAVSLTGMLEYLSMGVLSEGKSSAELAGVLGELQAVAYVLTLIINLALFGRIVGRLGVPNTALLLPLSYLTAFALLYAHAGPLAAIVAFYAYQSVLPGIEYNNVNLLFNAVNARAKPLLRTFVEAMAEPLATAFTGLFLLSLATRLGREHVALAGLLAASGALAIALFVRWQYVKALADNLRRDWLNFADPKRDWSAALPDSDRALLREKARSGERGEQRVAADLLWRARDPEAQSALRQLLATASPGEVPRLRPALALLLQTDDRDAAAAVRRWLEGPDAPTDPEVRDELTAAGLIAPRRVQGWQQSSDATTGLATAVPQWQSAEPEETEEMLLQIRDALSGSARERSWAIRSLGDFNHPRHLDEIAQYLTDSDAAVRTETLRTLGKLATPASTRLIARVLPLVAEATTEQRYLIFRLVARVGEVGAIAALLRASNDFTAAESRALETMIVELGLKTVPAVVEVVRDAKAPCHPRSVATRALSRLAMAQLLDAANDLLESELAQAHQHVADYRALVDSGAERTGPIAVLIRTYRDAAIETVELALELLGRTGNLPDYDLIRASLSFANAKDRANTLETIQQSCPRALFDRILFVIDQTAAGASPHAHGEPSSAEAVLRRASASAFPLKRAAACLALGATEVTADQAQAVRGVATLLQSAFFGEARIRTLDYLVRRATVRRSAAGEVIYERGAAVEPVLFIVMSGAVELSRPGRTTTATAGAVFGERVLMLDVQRSEQAVSQGAELLVLPAAAVERAIEIFPTLGISLYRFKTISAVR